VACLASLHISNRPPREILPFLLLSCAQATYSVNTLTLIPRQDDRANSGFLENSGSILVAWNNPSTSDRMAVFGGDAPVRVLCNECAIEKALITLELLPGRRFFAFLNDVWPADAESCIRQESVYRDHDDRYRPRNGFDYRQVDHMGRAQYQQSATGDEGKNRTTATHMGLVSPQMIRPCHLKE
jgi:hypothetical protein